jgi:hypothetical protein
MKRARDRGSALQQEVIPVAPNRSQLIPPGKCFETMPKDLTLVTRSKSEVDFSSLGLKTS